MGHLHLANRKQTSAGFDHVISMCATVEGIPGDFNHDGILADVAIALHLAANGGWDPARTSTTTTASHLDALMILQAAAGGVTL